MYLYHTPHFLLVFVSLFLMFTILFSPFQPCLQHLQPTDDQILSHTYRCYQPEDEPVTRLTNLVNQQTKTPNQKTKTDIQTDGKPTGKHTEGQTDGQINRQADRGTDRWTNQQASRHWYRGTDKWTNQGASRQRNRQMDKPTGKHREEQTDGPGPHVTGAATALLAEIRWANLMISSEDVECSLAWLTAASFCLAWYIAVA